MCLPVCRYLKIFLVSPLAVLTTLLGASGVGAQLPGLSETVDVRVVNFEVVVTDDGSVPIRGLTREDFELFVDGERTEIDYFSAVADGVMRDPGIVEDGDAPTLTVPGSDEFKPVLVIVLDNSDLGPGWVEKTVEEIVAQLGELTEVSRGVMVVRQGIDLETEQVFTTDRALLVAALERAGARRGSMRGVGERDALIRSIETGAAPSGSMSAAELLLVESEAESLLREIKAYQGMETYALERSASQLRALVRSLAGLPGRKEVLYLGLGFKMRPAESLFQMWEKKYQLIAPQLGIRSIEKEMGLEMINDEFLSVIEEANALKVVFNTYSPGGIISAGSNLRFSSVESTAVVDSEGDQQRQSLLTLARSTGGVGRVQISGLSPLLREMISGFRHFYSLGFDVDETLSGPGRVKVTVRGGDYRIRHLDRYRVKRAGRTLEDLTLAALITDLVDNPLEMSVDVDRPERQRDGTYVVPVLVKVPISMLTLLPEAESHVGRVDLVIQAQSAGGRLSEPVRGEIPIEIANSELLDALGQQAGYRLRMKVSRGEQKIAVAIRDEIARRDSALNLIINAGGGE
jgi:VWFA-related protein